YRVRHVDREIGDQRSEWSAVLDPTRLVADGDIGAGRPAAHRSGPDDDIGVGDAGCPEERQLRKPDARLDPNQAVYVVAKHHTDLLAAGRARQISESATTNRSKVRATSVIRLATR